MDNKHLENILIGFFSSSFLFIIFIFSVFFPFSPKEFFGIDILKAISLNASCILGYSILACIASCSAIFFLNFKNTFAKIFLYFIFFFYLALLIFIDSSAGWVILIIAALIGSYFEYKIKKGKGKSFAIGGIYLLIIIISLFLSCIDAGNFIYKIQIDSFAKKVSFFKIPPKDIELKESLHIVAASFRDNWLLGSGQSTFLYNLSKHAKGSSAERLSDLNRELPFNGDIKSPHFNKGYNYFFDIFTNLGLLGASSFLGLVVVFFATVVYIIKSEEEDAERNIIYFIFISSIAVVLIQLFINDNITILFLFWIFLAFMMVVLKFFSHIVLMKHLLLRKMAAGMALNFSFYLKLSRYFLLSVLV